jgi:hypothetical protein
MKGASEVLGERGPGVGVPTPSRSPAISCPPVLVQADASRTSPPLPRLRVIPEPLTELSGSLG